MPNSQPANWRTLVSLVLFIVAGYLMVGPMLGFAAMLPFFGFDTGKAMAVIGNPAQYPQARVAFLLFQGFSSIGWLLVIPYFYVKYILRDTFSKTFKPYMPRQRSILLVFGLVIVFMGADAKIIEWNQGIDFPAFLDGFEKWARSSEGQLKVITEYLTDFDSTWEFLLGFVVIAIIPAIGEEVLFRGLLQQQFSKVFQNPHAGIWIAAFFFSFIHFQFYGFVPRMLLGAMFGYLYWWSGNLVIPMVAHFVNNGFTVLMLYLYQMDMVGFNVEETEKVPWSVALPGIVATAVLLIVLKRVLTQERTQYEN